MIVQSILFEKARHSLASARAWLRAHHRRDYKVDITARYYRFRQVDPTPGSQFVTKNIGNGILFILESNNRFN